jgi:hypothetical protein
MLLNRNLLKALCKKPAKPKLYELSATYFLLYAPIEGQRIATPSVLTKPKRTMVCTLENMLGTVYTSSDFHASVSNFRTSVW